MQQLGKIGRRAGDGAAPRIYVLPEQRHFPYALVRKLRYFSQAVGKRPRDLFAAGVGHDAQAAVLAAPFHDRDDRTRAFGLRLGQVVELLDQWKADVDLRLAARAAPLEKLGQ